LHVGTADRAGILGRALAQAARAGARLALRPVTVTQIGPVRLLY